MKKEGETNLHTESLFTWKGCAPVSIVVLFGLFISLVGTAQGAEVTITFDGPVPSSVPFDLLEGVFEGIDFGTGQWRWEGAFDPNPTNHIFFNSGVGTSRTFVIASSPALLESLEVFTPTAGTLTVSDDQGQSVSRDVTLEGGRQVVQTSWTQPSSTVTIAFTAGWDLGIDDIVLSRTDALYVANNGIDSSTCGGESTPCRSINRAIQNASAGDTIMVGLGRYGSGQETPSDSNCNCMILVDKAVQLESPEGAGSIILDAEGFAANVRIVADGVVFGKRGKGFTLTGADFGLVTAASTSGAEVAGNWAIGNSTIGFEVNGSEHMVSDNLASSNGVIGFSVTGSGHTFTRNLASNNVGSGFLVNGSEHTFTENVASSNGNRGFDIRFTLGNSGCGLCRNAAQGNQGFGIIVNSSNLTITENNIFGNDVGGSNCGLVNMSGVSLFVPNNFWGAANGPGAEPADEACGSLQGGSIDVNPVAIEAFDIPMTAGE